MKSVNSICLLVKLKAEVRKIEVLRGANLRKALLGAGFSPYRGSRRRFNCHGLGICGSCRVIVSEDSQKWLRRSCQIRCFQDMEIELQ